METTIDSLSQQQIQTRCPSCLKLFAIDVAEVNEANPVFECSACHAQFAVELKLTEMEETQSRLLEPSPSKKADEPTLDPNQIANEIALGAKPELILLWKRIIDDYEDEMLHEAFIQACDSSDALGYAGAKYARILAEFPAEAIALKMRAKIQALAAAEVDAINLARAKQESPDKKRLQPVPMPVLSLTSIAIILGTILTLIGLTMPGQKNLLAIGVSMLALVIGVRFFYQRNSAV